jgi:hypothetical protein
VLLLLLSFGFDRMKKTVLTAIRGIATPFLITASRMMMRIHPEMSTRYLFG